MKLFFYDLETSGLDARKNGILQLAYRIFANGKLHETKELTMRLFPHQTAEPTALEINGHTNYEQYECPRVQYRELIADLQYYVDKYNRNDKLHLVGYNNRAFDDVFFREYFSCNDDNYFGSWFWSDSIDVLPIASLLLRKQRHTMPNFKLATVAEHLGFNVDTNNLHDANYDLYLTICIYQKCVETFKI